MITTEYYTLITYTSPCIIISALKIYHNVTYTCMITGTSNYEMDTP